MSSERVFADAGFRLVYSGRGRTAWSRKIAAGRYLIITDSAGTSHKLGAFHAGNERIDDRWLIGVHEVEDGSRGALEYREAETAEIAVQEAASLEKAHRNGDGNAGLAN